MEQIAILTGDIVGSRSMEPSKWLPVLTESLAQYSEKFDIFRGDSFQAEVRKDKCLESIFYVKSKLKSLGDIDVRIGLGLGTIDYNHPDIKNSMGEAFLFSGEAFDSLGKDLFRVRTSNEDWDSMTNIMMQLAMELASKWTVNMSESVAVNIMNPTASQQELANLLQRKHQSQVSTELSKANWIKIKQAIDYCTYELIK